MSARRRDCGCEPWDRSRACPRRGRWSVAVMLLSGVATILLVGGAIHWAFGR